jgi:hypothetical protein
MSDDAQPQYGYFLTTVSPRSYFILGWKRKFGEYKLSLKFYLSGSTASTSVFSSTNPSSDGNLRASFLWIALTPPFQRFVLVLHLLKLRTVLYRLVLAFHHTRLGARPTLYQATTQAKKTSSPKGPNEPFVGSDTSASITLQQS